MSSCGVPNPSNPPLDLRWEKQWDEVVEVETAGRWDLCPIEENEDEGRKGGVEAWWRPHSWLVPRGRTEEEVMTGRGGGKACAEVMR